MVSTIIFILCFVLSLPIVLFTHNTPYFDGFIVVAFLACTFYLVFEQIPIPPEEVVRSEPKVHKFLKSRFTVYGRSMLTFFIISSASFFFLVNIKIRLGLAAVIGWAIMVAGYIVSLKLFANISRLEVPADYIANKLNIDPLYILKVLKAKEFAAYSEKDKKIVEEYKVYIEKTKDDLVSEEIFAIKQKEKIKTNKSSVGKAK